MKIKRTRFNLSEKTNIATPIQETRTIKYIIYAFFAFTIIGATAPYWHIFLSKEYKTGKLLYEEPLTLEDNQELVGSFKVKVKDGIIQSVIPFKEERLPRVFGFSNTRTFLAALGIPLSLFICSYILLYVSIFRLIKYRTSFLIFSSLFLYSSIFQIIWVFWYRNDLPTHIYYTSIAISSILFTLGAIYFIRYFDTFFSKIDSFLDFLVEIRNVHYKKMLKRSVESNLYDEAYLEKIKKDTKKFEKRMFDKSEDFIDGI